MIEDEILDSDWKTVERQPVNVFLLVVLMIGVGIFIGGTTNAINGRVSEEYYRRILGWNFDEIWEAAILQGVFEGVIYGLIFGLIFIIGLAIITKMKVSWSFVIQLMKKVIVLIYVCWLFCGFAAMILAYFFPEEYGAVIYKAPIETVAKLRFAWVGGSIWGAIVGGLISAIYGLSLIRREWKRISNT